MNANLIHFTKMQFNALSQVALLQLLCVFLFPMFFSKLNQDRWFVTAVIFFIGLYMVSYLVLRNFAFNDEKYKTKLFFHMLPLTPSTVISARGLVVYGLSLAATPILVVTSHLMHAIKPDLFMFIPLSIIPLGLLLTAIFVPIQFIIFQVFQAQKADIIGALSTFPILLLLLALEAWFPIALDIPYWVGIVIIAVGTNMACYKFSVHLYRKRA